MFKSKLNELCQKSGWGSPVYSRIKDGPDHCPLFRATVVVNGLTFKSSSAFKNCKAAYNDVAQIAFYNFLAFSQVPIDGMHKTKKLKIQVMSKSPDLKTAKEEVPNAAEQKIENLKPLIMSPSSNLNTGDLDATSESCLPVLPSEAATQIAPSDHPVLSVNEPVPKKSMESYMLQNKAIEDTPETNSKKSVDSYMLCNKVRVYTSYPDMPLPKGTIVLPIAKNKWTIISLGKY